MFESYMAERLRRRWVRLRLYRFPGSVLTDYLIDVKQSKATWSWINALAQIVVSGFTGVIGGLISIESGFSIYMILATAGISGAMGSVALTYFWERLTGVKNAKS